MKRRDFILSAGSALSALVLPRRAGFAQAAVPPEIRIGYQKSGILAIAKQLKLIETRFASAKVAIRWVEFPYGPPLMEALGTGRLDYGYTGNAPPIFAQAAKAPILYVAALPAHGENVGIIVRAGSSIKTLADLKGKTIGVARGSSGHDLLVSALESAHVEYHQISPAYLTPADGASAFSRGSIDAWSIWDPFLAIAEQSQPVRRLAISKEASAQSAFFLANRDFALKYPDVVAALNADAAAAAAYVGDHRDEAALLFARDTGVPLEIQKTVVARSTFAVTPVTPEIAATQQAVADRFARIGLIPAPVNVAQAVWAWTPS